MNVFLKFIIASSFTLFYSMSFAQQIPNEIPKQADISVNGIFLDDTLSVRKILGDTIHFVEDTNTIFDIMPHSNYINEYSTEILIATFHPGNYRWEFSEFNVMRFSKKNKESVTLLKKINQFSTYKRIYLGITLNDLIKILGENFKKEIIDDLLLLKYQIDDYKNSSFLKFYNLPYYYGKYYFRNDILIEMKFGFKYP